MILEKAHGRAEETKSEEGRLVVLYGDSLLMDTIEASLDACQDLGVMRIHATVTDVGGRLESLCPDLIIVDLNTPHSQQIVPFLWDHPGIPMLGLDITCGRVVAMSCEPYLVQSVSDLAELVDKHTSNGNGRRAQERES
jgi:NAD(P)H-hydrate repair Nnr-like enzyme with NAD(P)H-hydrate dehydratase domain